MTQLSGTVTLGPQGRIVIPSEVRAKLHLKLGSELVYRVEDQHLIIETRDEVLRRLQEAWKAAAPPERILSEELIAERRLEAERELLDP